MFNLNVVYIFLNLNQHNISLNIVEFVINM